MVLLISNDHQLLLSVLVSDILVTNIKKTKIIGYLL